MPIGKLRYLAGSERHFIYKKFGRGPFRVNGFLGYDGEWKEQYLGNGQYNYHYHSSRKEVGLNNYHLYFV